MEFQGQKLAEQLCLYIILASGVAAFLSGWFEGSFSLMMKVGGNEPRVIDFATPHRHPCLAAAKCGIHKPLLTQVYGGGVTVAMLACVPDWPWFNRDPQKWLPASQMPMQQATLKTR